MKILLIADLHSDDNYVEEKIRKSLAENPDCVILLGDIKSSDLSLISQSFKCPIYGITGDDDTPNVLDKYTNIDNIDGAIVSIGDFKIGGFSGSLRYKRGMFSMRTEEEAKALLKYMMPCDLFVSHETGFGYMKAFHEEEDRLNAIERSKYEAAQRDVVEEKKGIFSKITSIFNKKDDEEEFSDVRSSIVTEKASEDTMYDGFEAIDEYLKNNKPKIHLFGHHHMRKHFDRYSTTCGCVYLFEMLELNNGSMNLTPIESDQEKLDKIQAEKRLKENIDEMSEYLNMSSREKRKFDKNK